MGWSSRSYGIGGQPTSESLAGAAQRLDTLLSNLPSGVIEADLQGRITYANAMTLRSLGVTEEELDGRTLAEVGFEHFGPDGTVIAPEHSPLVRAAHAGEDGVRAVMRCVRSSSVDVWIDSRTTPLKSELGEPQGSLMSFVEVTGGFGLADGEARAMDRMSEALRSTAVGVLFVDAEGRIEYANPAAAATSGLKPEDVVGQLAADPAWQLTDETGAILPYDELPVPTALRERREVRGVELGVPTLTGAVTWLRVSAQPLSHPDGSLRGAVVTTEDVTERHNLAEQLQQAQKIEGIGQLAGGIAHDFNNLLTVIIGHAELALARSPEGPMVAGIESICDAANRGSALTRQMLTFARKQVVQPRPVHLGQLATSVESLLQRIIGEEVDLKCVESADLWAVRVDPGQMEQVLVNMAINARDAMAGDGSLTLETCNLAVDAKQAHPHPGVEPGEFVQLSIADNGAGIPRDVLPRIFDPFFTTKPSGSGTGIGLSICHGVVKQARGFITVDSEPGRGTTFSILLPRCAEEPRAVTAPRESAPTRGGGTILLVEDQEPVRKLVARALGGYGYHVVSASNGREALTVHQNMTGPVDLLLTDVVMPVMGGSELASIMQERVPGLPVLYMTGFVDSQSVGLSEPDAEQAVLLKPFTPMQLLQRVQQLLPALESAERA